MFPETGVRPRFQEILQAKKSRLWEPAKSNSQKEVEETGVIMMRCRILIHFIFIMPIIPLVNIT